LLELKYHNNNEEDIRKTITTMLDLNKVTITITLKDHNLTLKEIKYKEIQQQQHSPMYYVHYKFNMAFTTIQYILFIFCPRFPN